MALSQLHGVAIANSLKFQRSLVKTLKSYLKQFFLWLKWKSLKLTQQFVPSVPLLKRVWIKVKVQLQPSLFNKVPCMFKTQSLLVIPSDVSVLWPMTLVVVLRLQHHQHQFQLLVWTKRLWRVTILPFMKMKKQLVQPVKNVPNVPLWNNVNKHIVLVLITSLIPLKLVNWRLLMLSSRPTYKVLLKPWQHHFLRLMLRVFVLMLFTQQ